MSLGHAILGFLNREPMTGYDLKTKCFDRTVEHFWTADQAQVYRTLDRLEAKGLVTSEVDVQFGRPDRKVFTITGSGREALKEFLARPRPLPAVRDPFLVQLFFSGELPDEEVLGLLRSAREQHKAKLDSLDGEPGRTGSPPRTVRSKRVKALHGMTLSAARSRERSAVEWLDDCIATVEQGLPGRPAHSGRFLEK